MSKKREAKSMIEIWNEQSKDGIRFFDNIEEARKIKEKEKADFKERNKKK